MRSSELLISTVVLFACVNELAALDDHWPVLAFESGSVAHIPCMVRGETKAYFWRKGSAYNMSDHVAANVHGVPDEFANTTQGKLTVMGDGTLVIYDISPEDDDTYFCRVVTQTSEHYGGVIVYSQASLDSALSIDKCPPYSSCKVVLEPSSNHRFICTASYVSSMVDVRWIDNNGTVIKSSSAKDKNIDGSYNISRRIELTYHSPTLLYCEAFSPSVKGEFIHIQVETKQEHEDQNDGYFVAFLVTLVASIVIIVTLSAVCKRFSSKGEVKEKGSDEEGLSLKEDEVDKLQSELKKIKDEKNFLFNEKKKIKDEKNFLFNEKKDLHLDLELSERKYRAHIFKVKDKHKVFLRVRPQAGNLIVSTSSDKMQGWRDHYNFTQIFSQDATQETIFTDIETAELIQDSVDGGKTCIFAFGGPNSGRTYTMKGQEKKLGTDPDVGLIPRAVRKVFQLVDDLKRNQIEVKVTVSRLKGYQTMKGDSVATFVELNNLNQEKNVFYNVQGLNVEMKVYTVSRTEEVLDLLWEEHSDREDKTETCDILQMYIETLKGSKSISKGSLSLAILSATEATRQFSGQRTGNRSIRPLLEPFLKDDKCNMVIIANIDSEMSQAAMETLNAVTKIKLERTMSPKKPVDERL